ERSRPEHIELSRWAESFVEEFRSVHPLELDNLATAVQRCQPVLVDPNHLQQIAWNLVQNALRYGRKPAEPARVVVSVRPLHDGGPPVLEVSDRGPGIPEKVAARIFEPFFTTHEHGTGLGLYIARELCEANQGSLDFVPVAGGGSCFRITLPVAARVTATSRAPGSASTGGRRAIG
ncbi:MAG TPA: HAMP domain-containing sensor histidine kinase, partial [Candidatus Saccharimonadia bacterium]|nr:HAMP domain-containing sensor histidine kinase [Candidatus Saccharimonadia bacterium]